MADRDPEHPLADGCPPEWASEWGVDEYGLFVGLTVGEVDVRFRWVPPGEFMMGSPEDEEGRWDDEGPQHRVKISRGFWLGETPVTQALWEEVMGGNPSEFKGPSRPVEQVSWEDCQAFLERLNGQVPELGVGLPSEAEWEYACWAASEGVRYGELDEVAWHSGNSDGETHAVGQLQPNQWGLYDMLGNVEEWCADRWQEDAYANRGALTEDPLVTDTGGHRVFRGGSWSGDARGCRAAYRDWSPPGGRNDWLGFRLARGQGRSPSQETGKVAAVRLDSPTEETESTKGRVERDGGGVRRGPSRPRRLRRVAWSQPTPASVIEVLDRREVVEPGADAPTPDVLRRSLLGTDASAWGRWAGQDSTRRLVDDALDALTISELGMVLRAVDAQGEPSSLAQLAALESLLAVIARRVYAAEQLGFESDDAERVQRLLLRQIGQLKADPHTSYARYPLTRRDFNEWYATGWALSLSVAPPEDYTPDGFPWELPGWASGLSFDEMPLRRFPSWAAGPFSGYIASLSQIVIRRVEKQELPDEVSGLLLPALFIDHERGWTLTAQHLDGTQGWNKALLAYWARNLDGPEQSSLADRIWGLLGDRERQGRPKPIAWRLVILRNTQPELVDFVLQDVSPECMFESARDHGVLDGSVGFPREFDVLPRTSIRAAVRGWIAGLEPRPTNFADAQNLLPLLKLEDDEDLGVAVEMTYIDERFTSAQPTERIWEVAPERARVETSAAVRENRASMYGWFFTAPYGEDKFLLEQLDSLEELPDWTAQWAGGRLANAGDEAERMFELSRGRLVRKETLSGLVASDSTVEAHPDDENEIDRLVDELASNVIDGDEEKAEQSVQDLAKVLGIAAVVAVGVFAVGGLLYWLYKEFGDGKKTRTSRGAKARLRKQIRAELIPQLKDLSESDAENEQPVLVEEHSRTARGTPADYSFLAIKDVSHGLARRVSARIVVSPELSNEDVASVVRYKTGTLKKHRFDVSGVARRRWSGDAQVVWLYVYRSVEDEKNNNWFCRSEWIDPALDPDGRPIAMDGEDVGDGITVTWNSNADEMSNFIRDNSLERSEYLAAVDEIMNVFRPAFIVVLEVYAAHASQRLTSDEYESQLSEATAPIKSLYDRAIETGIAPVECNALRIAFQKLMAQADNIRLPVSDRGRGTWPTQANRIRLVDQAIRGTVDDLGEFDDEYEKLCGRP